MSKNILILGKNGQVGRHLTRVLPDAVAWGRKEIDLCDSELIRSKIEALRPTHIVNAAAYTAVDQAEVEEDLAHQINAIAVGEIAKAAAGVDAHLIHFSTDYVFDGTKAGAYSPTDPVNPINAYGRTKLAGEREIVSHCKHFWILRTSWVFSEFSGNFLTTMLRLGKERSSIDVVNDQFGQPTYAGELASAVGTLVQGTPKLPSGVHHLSCPGPTTWFEFAECIFAKLQETRRASLVPNLVPVASSAFPTPAERPKNSVLGEPAIAMRRWQDCIAQAIA